MRSGTTETVSPAEAAAALERGEVLVVPTETVYGLAVQAGRPSSVARVFELKARPADAHLPVQVGSVDQLDALGVVRGDVSERLEAHWPGPLTLVYPLGDACPSWLAGRPEVAVRIPDHAWLRRVAALAGPLLVTSANRHGRPPAQDLAAAVAGLAGAPDLAVDGGTVGAEASTIVNLAVSPPRILRQGALGAEELGL